MAIKWLGFEHEKAQRVETDIVIPPTPKSEDMKDPYEYYKLRGVEALTMMVRGEGDRKTWEQATELALMAKKGEI